MNNPFRHRLPNRLRIAAVIVLTLMVGSILVIGCDESAVDPLSSHSDSMQKWIPHYDSLRNEAIAIASQLAQSRTWINSGTIAALADGAVPMATINPSLPATVTWVKIKFDSIGTPFPDTVTGTVTLGILNPARLGSALNPSQVYGVMPDPDRFYGRDSIGGTYSVPTSLSSSTSTNISLLHPNGDEAQRIYPIDLLEYPIFIVSFEEIGTEGAPTGPAGSKASVGKYVVVNQIKLKTKCDNSDDEFELYVTEENYNINQSTSWKFDGKTRNDAKGNNLTFKDVNGKSTYTMASDIYLYNLTGVTVRMAAIEDDDDPGVIDRGSGSGTTTQSIKHYRVSTNTNMTNDWIFNKTGTSLFSDNDDFYLQSGVDKINETNMNTRLNGRSYFNTNESDNGLLNDVEYKLGMKQ